MDDASPITCSTFLLGYFQRLPDLRLSFNIKLAVVFYCIFPLVFYVQLGLYLALKRKYIQEWYMKLSSAWPWIVGVRSLGDLGFQSGNFPHFYTSSSVHFQLIGWAFTSLMIVLFARPKDLFVQESKDNRISITDNIRIMPKIVYSSVMSFFLRLHNRGFKMLLNLFTCSSQFKINRDASRKTRALCVLWVLFSILPTLILGLVFGAICFFLCLVALLYSIVGFSPMMIFLFCVLRNIFEKMAVRLLDMRLPFCSCFLVFFFSLIILSYVFAIIFVPLLSISIQSCNFVVGMIGFITMGLVLNAEIVTPYIAFFLVTTTNHTIHLCYANFQSRYKEVKGFILKYSQKETQTICSDQETIPTKLFWFVCDREFPVEKEICLMFRNIAVRRWNSRSFPGNETKNPRTQDSEISWQKNFLLFNRASDFNANKCAWKIKVAF